MVTQREPSTSGTDTTRRPRIACIGLGWIGCTRLERLVREDLADVVALVDPEAGCRSRAAELAGAASCHRDPAELAGLELDGVVVATPNALHAAQCIEQLRAGRAVFCQKPLGRDADETAAVLAAARAADRLLDVDLSYRHLRGFRAARELVRAGGIGRPFAGRFVFHNAYGPDKPWFGDRRLSGGGCVLDLGIHLVDLALAFFTAEVEAVVTHRYRQGRRSEPTEVEDHAIAQLCFADGAVVELACSWWAPAGSDAVIEATIVGDRAGVGIRNIGGSFYDFRTVELSGTSEREIVREDGSWGGGALIDWTRRLARTPRFDPAAERLLRVAGLVDRLYGR